MKPQETVKDRARQAYLDQQTQDSEGGCGQPIGFIYGFIAGEESAKEQTRELRLNLIAAKEMLLEVSRINEEYSDFFQKGDNLHSFFWEYSEKLKVLLGNCGEHKE